MPWLVRSLQSLKSYFLGFRKSSRENILISGLESTEVIVPNHMLDAVCAYLKKENTQYAILIDGDWGSGKTHFYKYGISQLVDRNGSIYVSLFGLKEIYEIENEMYKALSNVSIDNVGLMKGILSENQELLGGFGGAGLVVQFGLNKWKKKVLKEGSSLLLCFDDIERWEGDIGVYLAYINKLVEHDGCKCILMGNIGAIGEIEEFTKGREKTIRHVYKFEYNIDEILKISLGLTKFYEDHSKEFITGLVCEYQGDIARILEGSNHKNIRTVVEAIQFFEAIYVQNIEAISKSRRLANNYFNILLAAVILLKNHVISSDDQQVFFEYAYEDKSLLDLRKVFEDEENNDPYFLKIPESNLLAETIFYRDENISIQGIFSIIKNGYYIGQDFQGSFDNWEPEKPYERYLQAFEFLHLEDDEAEALVNKTLDTVFIRKEILNPVLLVNIMDRVFDDLARDSIIFPNPEEKFRSLFAELYESKRMLPKTYSDFNFPPGKFVNCQDIYREILAMNDAYNMEFAFTKLKAMWAGFAEHVNGIKEYLSSYLTQPIFDSFDDPEDAIRAMECLPNYQLFEMARWMGSRVRDPNCLEALQQEVKKSELLADQIDKLYHDKYSVRAGHYKQIANVLRLKGQELAAKTE